MLTRAFVETLHCPYCGGALQLDTDLAPQDEAFNWGTVRCACYRYPVVDSILVLQQHSPLSDTTNTTVDLLDAGNRMAALAHALSATSPVSAPRSSVQRALDKLVRTTLGVEVSGRQVSYRGVIDDSTLSFSAALRALRPIHFADYLFYRHANTSFLASIPLLAAFSGIEQGMVFDLGCGIGHSSFLIHRLFPQLNVIASDHDVVNLYIAKHYIDPDLTYLCLDTEHPLPFADETFAGIWCLDAMHYHRSKAALGRELKRAGSANCIWLLPHLHNALAENFTPGIPLPPDDYLRVFAPLNPRLFVESDILRGFTGGGSLDLTQQPLAGDLRAAQVVSLVGSGQLDVWRQHGGLVQRLIEVGDLQINPIYQRSEAETSVKLKIAFPSPQFEAECKAVTEFLPPECEIERGLLDRLGAGTLTGQDAAQVERLLRSFALVSLPDGYKAHSRVP